MNELKVNLENLTESERQTLLKLVEKSKQQVKLSEIKDGETFKIGDTVFIKFSDENGETTAVTKDILFSSTYGDNNNLKESCILEKLSNEFLPKIAEAVGFENICNISTDLTTLDGLKPYGVMTSKISLPTYDFYRANVDVFDKYNPGKWWWLATPESAKPHSEPNWIVCVSPSGCFNIDDDYLSLGVRPFLRFVSSISVSYED